MGLLEARKDARKVLQDRARPSDNPEAMDCSYGGVDANVGWSFHVVIAWIRG